MLLVARKLSSIEVMCCLYSLLAEKMVVMGTRDEAILLLPRTIGAEKRNANGTLESEELFKKVHLTQGGRVLDIQYTPVKH